MPRDARWTIHTPRGELTIAYEVVPRAEPRREAASAAALQAWFVAARIARELRSRARWGTGVEDPERAVRQALARSHLRVERRVERIPHAPELREDALLHDGVVAREDLTWIAVRLAYDDPSVRVGYARHGLTLPARRDREARAPRP